MNTNQVRKLLSSGDANLREEVTRVWGTLREERSLDRENVIRQARQLVRTTAGNGRGRPGHLSKDVRQLPQALRSRRRSRPRPDREWGAARSSNYSPTCSTPALVIGAAYQARTVVTVDGRILNGLLVEDSPQRIVLKQQGGKLEAVSAFADRGNRH